MILSTQYPPALLFIMFQMPVKSVKAAAVIELPLQLSVYFMRIFTIVNAVCYEV